MTMRLTVNGNDFGECLACDFDFAERRVRMATCAETPDESLDRHRLHKADQMAREIADESAISMVDSCSNEVDRDGVKWRELGDEYFGDLEYEFEYLELRGLLERDPANRQMVRLLEES